MAYCKTMVTQAHQQWSYHGHAVIHWYIHTCNRCIQVPFSPLPQVRWELSLHDDAIKWKHFPRCRPFVRGIHWSPMISPHKDQWRGALMLSLICAWTNGSANNRGVGDLRHHRAHYDVTMFIDYIISCMTGLRHGEKTPQVQCLLSLLPETALVRPDIIFEVKSNPEYGQLSNDIPQNTVSFGYLSM